MSIKNTSSILDSPNIHVCHIIGGLNVGGAERFLYRLVRYNDDPNIIMSVISLSDIGVIGERLQKYNVTVRSVGMKKSPLDIFRFFKLLYFLIEKRPNIIHSWLYLSDIIAGIAGKVLKIPVIWGVRQANLNKNDNECSTLIYARISALLSCILPKKIIYCAESGLKNHKKFGYRGNSVVIANGIDTDKYQPVAKLRKIFRNNFGITDDILLIGMVARYHLQKGHADFIKMAKILKTQNDNLKFILVGAGVNNSRLITLVNQAKLSDTLLLIEHVDNIPQVMNGLDIYVSSSIGEGWPNAVAEAMACGLPCVATDVGDTKLIVGDVGEIVNPGCPELLANAVTSLLKKSSNEFNLLKKRSRTHIVENFQISKSVKHYQDLYLSLVS